MKCREPLEPGAIACVECGTRTGQPVEAAVGIASDSASPVTMPPNRNTLSYQEDRNSRRFEASLTDSAMHGLGGVFDELFARAGTTRVGQANGMRSLVKNMVIDETKQLTGAPVANEDHQPPPPADTTARPAGHKEHILRIFAVNGETLELIDNRLKATTAADYYRRLTYLFLYAHELHGRTSTPRADVVKLLKDAKVFDPNCRTWLKQKKGITVDVEDRVKLNVGAREKAVKALNEALDSTFVDQWNPDNRTVKPKGPKKKKG